MAVESCGTSGDSGINGSRSVVLTLLAVSKRCRLPRVTALGSSQSDPEFVSIHLFDST